MNIDIIINRTTVQDTLVINTSQDSTYIYPNKEYTGKCTILTIDNDIYLCDVP